MTTTDDHVVIPLTVPRDANVPMMLMYSAVLPGGASWLNWELSTVLVRFAPSAWASRHGSIDDTLAALLEVTSSKVSPLRQRRKQDEWCEHAHGTKLKHVPEGHAERARGGRLQLAQARNK